MTKIYWKSAEGGRKTNISYNCVDRHVAEMENKFETAFVWEGNYWDDDVHDYADLNWETVDVLTQKIANIFKDYCEMNPAKFFVDAIKDVLKETQPKLVVTVDAFWQGSILLETKKCLDLAIEESEVISIQKVLVIRHTGPNPGIPPPDKFIIGRRPFYKLEVKMNDTLDILWTTLVKQADANCEVVWLPADHPFAILPEWNPSLRLRTISTGKLLRAVEKYSREVIPFCLSLPHPQTPLGLVGCFAPWFVGIVLTTFEGILEWPDPSRLKHLIAKYEIKSAILPTCKLDPEYMTFVPVPTLRRIITEVGNATTLEENFSDVEIIEMDVEKSLR
ncbi:hypothetical protein ANCCAN_21270 [Ancylostoma caninum]|uniref:Uncharacterized protein n=1 Tax=Ancylostoma caninum TaxID=29170 RepID=A0A368FL93_ANCCA|nr:hypothetical protein ANCCAN_21270 [Ancylostoma caninum]